MSAQNGWFVHYEHSDFPLLLLCDHLVETYLLKATILSLESLSLAVILISSIRRSVVASARQNYLSECLHNASFPYRNHKLFCVHSSFPHAFSPGRSFITISHKTSTADEFDTLQQAFITVCNSSGFAISSRSSVV